MNKNPRVEEIRRDFKRIERMRLTCIQAQLGPLQDPTVKPEVIRDLIAAYDLVQKQLALAVESLEQIQGTMRLDLREDCSAKTILASRTLAHIREAVVEHE